MNSYNIVELNSSPAIAYIRWLNIGSCRRGCWNHAKQEGGEYVEIVKYWLKVDYGVDVTGLIRAGRYDSQHTFASTEAPLLTGLGVVLIEAFIVTEMFEKLFDYLELDELRRHGWQGANLRELLSFGMKYPEVQLDTTIIATGSMCRDSSLGRCYPELWGKRNWREREEFRALGVHWHKWAFHPGYGLLVVPEGTPGR